MKQNLILLIVICVLLIAFGWLISVQVRNFGTQALAPVTDSMNAVQTQVSKALHPTPTVIPDPVTIINEVRALARLETIQYSVEKIITADSGQEVLKTLFGDRLLFVAHGIVIAGVDMNVLQADDLHIRDGVLTVNLPDAEIFIASLDNDKSYVYDRQTGLFTKGETDLETLARQAAEEEIQKAAMEDGILDQAELNAEVYLTRLFQSLGYDKVIFE